MTPRGSPFLPALVISMVGITPLSLDAQATHTIGRFTSAFVFDDVNPCNDEPVVLTGSLRITLQVTVDDQGTSHFKYTLVPTTVRGTETATGVEYLAVGGEREQLSIGSDTLRVEDTVTNTFNLISLGGTDNVIAHVTFHLTVNDSGVLTALVGNVRAECRG